jgi:hypothetical protein
MRLTALLVLIIVIWCCSAKPNRRRGPGGRNRDPAAPEQRNGRGNKRPGGRGRGRVTPPPGDSIEEIEGDIDMEDDEMFPDPTDVDNGDENTDNGLNDQDCPEPDQLDEAEGSCTFDMTHNMENLDFLASVVFSENVFIFEVRFYMLLNSYYFTVPYATNLITTQLTVLSDLTIHFHFLVML